MKKINLLIVCLSIIAIETFAGGYQTAQNAQKEKKRQDLEKSKVVATQTPTSTMNGSASGSSSEKTAESPTKTEVKQATPLAQPAEPKQAAAIPPKK